MYKVWTCKRCGHQWVNKINRVPKRCPNCNNENYDKDKLSKASVRARKIEGAS